MKVSEYIKLLSALPDQAAPIVMQYDDEWWDITSIEYNLETNQVILKSEDDSAWEDEEEVDLSEEEDFDDDIPFGDVPNIPNGTLKVL